MATANNPPASWKQHPLPERENEYKKKKRNKVVTVHETFRYFGFSHILRVLSKLIYTNEYLFSINNRKFARAVLVRLALRNSLPMCVDAYHRLHAHTRTFSCHRGCENMICNATQIQDKMHELSTIISEIQTQNQTHRQNPADQDSIDTTITTIIYLIREHVDQTHNNDSNSMFFDLLLASSSDSISLNRCLQ